MKFQTPVPVKRQSPEIDYNSTLVLMGSCFVEHIGEKLGYYNFRSYSNRFGVIFNPYSIANLLERAVSGRFFTEKDIFFFNERWHCFEVHSVCSGSGREEMLEGLNRGVRELQENIRSASHLVVTLGTAWVYRHLESDRVVANCHKVPQKAFSKELLDVAEVKLQLERTDHLVRSLNPDCAVIVTVSPVRHLKDGVVENQRSKAHLIAALHNFLEEASHWNYFPSYEILMDELRDYRFYADDMLHPSGMAVEVVWQRFVDSWMAEEAVDLMKRVDRIRKGLQHRPFDPNSEAHRAFLQKLEAEVGELTGRYPYMKF